MTGTLDEGPDALPPKGEFFTSQRNAWMPQIPGKSCSTMSHVETNADCEADTFQKKHIQA